MRAPVVFHLAWADLCERTRRFGFFLVLAFTLTAAASLVPAAGANYAAFTIDNYRGYYNAAWVGMALALSTTTFLSFVGFYLVRGNIERDTETGVGQILAGTLMTKREYISGKLLSNVALLSIIIVLTALVTPVALHLRGEDQTQDFIKLASPFALITWPAMVVVAAVAVIFEIVPSLRGGKGNLAYGFLWSFFSMMSSNPKDGSVLDMLGFVAPLRSLQAAAYSQDPAIHINNLGLGFKVNLTGHPFKVFFWDGWQWPLSYLVARLFWLGMAIGIALFAARLFRRFDTTQAQVIRLPLGKETGAVREQAALHPAVPGPLAAEPADAHLTPQLRTPFRMRYISLLLAELRLTLNGVSGWWFAITAGLMVAMALAPLKMAADWLLPVTAVWPLLLLSPLGNREQQRNVGHLVLASPYPLLRQLPMTWLSGVLLVFIMMSSMFYRFAAAGQYASVLALLVGVLFIPTLALALGTWTGSSLFFQVGYGLLWYVGPFQKVYYLDFLGISHPGGLMPLLFAGITTALYAGAMLGRRHQLQA